VQRFLCGPKRNSIIKFFPSPLPCKSERKTMSLAALRENDKQHQVSKAVKRCLHFLSNIRVMINLFMQRESSHGPLL
jgi:hypothetical protein